MCAPTASADSCQFHIIQAVRGVEVRACPSGRRSPCSRCSLTCSSSAAGAVDDRLRRTGRAGGEHHEKRVVEGQPRPVRGRHPRRRVHEIGEPVDGDGVVRGQGRVVEDDDLAQGGQAPD